MYYSCRLLGGNYTNPSTYDCSMRASVFYIHTSKIVHVAMTYLTRTHSLIHSHTQRTYVSTVSHTRALKWTLHAHISLTRLHTSRLCITRGCVEAAPLPPLRPPSRYSMVTASSKCWPPHRKPPPHRDIAHRRNRLGI